MILIDTNILIDYFRGVDTILDNLLEQDEPAICGIVLAELLHGVDLNRHRELIDEAVQDFKWIHIDDSLWQALGNNLNHLRKNGVNIPFQDAVLATLCIEKNIPIATGDGHFEKIAEVLRDLKIHR
jgi:predicted nucleic acid-binding protein